MDVSEINGLIFADIFFPFAWHILYITFLSNKDILEKIDYKIWTFKFRQTMQMVDSSNR